MTIAFASDHGGFALKQELMAWAKEQGHQVEDFGCSDLSSCDYPDFGEAAARAVASGACDRGVVICTTGIGISISANKVGGIRCALCGDLWSAEMCRRHNDANMLAMGAGVVGPLVAREILAKFLSTPFEETSERHCRRVAKVNAIRP